jgi:hypothetical protein
VARHGGTLGPAGFVAKRDNARPGRRTAAVGRGLEHDAGDILAGTPALGPHLKEPQFAAIEREGAHRNERLIRTQFRLRHLADRGRVRPSGRVDDGEHAGMPQYHSGAGEAGARDPGTQNTAGTPLPVVFMDPGLASLRPRPG